MNPQGRFDGFWGRPKKNLSKDICYELDYQKGQMERFRMDLENEEKKKRDLEFYMNKLNKDNLKLK